MEPQPDIYISGDIEADGPIPGRFSMLSFGLAVAGRFDGRSFSACDPTSRTFYRELRPISERYEPAALEVGKLDRQALLETGDEPAAAMTEAADWVRETVGADRPVLVGFPAPFDWMFLYWYFVAFSNTGSPFDFSACLDMKTIFQQKAKVVTARAGLDDLPEFLRSNRPHTHNALDDAVEQADIFARLFTWEGS